MINSIDRKYSEQLKLILEKGSSDTDANVRPIYKDGTPAHTDFITQTTETFNIAKGEFPLTSLRKIPWKSSIKEILWIYQDQSNDLTLLKDKYNVTWWDAWDIGNGTIGQRYGAVVARHHLIDNLLKGLIENPYGRRHIMDLWQYDDLNTSKGLYPCAFMTLWSVRDNYLDATLIQRSSDICVANHINKLQYVALQMMIARHCNLQVGKFTHFVQNLHIYDRHIKQANELIQRQINNPELPMPRLILNPEKKDFYSFTIQDFTIENYSPLTPQLTFDLGI